MLIYQCRPFASVAYEICSNINYQCIRMGLLIYCYLSFTAISYVFAYPAVNTPPNTASTATLNTLTFTPGTHGTGFTNFHDSGPTTTRPTASRGTGQTGLYPMSGRLSSDLLNTLASSATRLTSSSILDFTNSTRSNTLPPISRAPAVGTSPVAPTAPHPTQHLTTSTFDLSNSGNMITPSAASQIEPPNSRLSAGSTSVTSTATESVSPAQIEEFKSATSVTALTISGKPILLQKQTLSGFAALAGATTITTSGPTATAWGGVEYANGPIVVGPQGSVWGVFHDDHGEGSRQSSNQGGSNDGDSGGGGGGGFIGLMGVGGQGLGKEGLGGGPTGAIGNAANGAAGAAGAVGGAAGGLGGASRPLGGLGTGGGGGGGGRSGGGEEGGIGSDSDSGK